MLICDFERRWLTYYLIPGPRGIRESIKAAYTGDALEMQDAVGAFNKKRVAEGKEPVYAGVGITTGVVVAGNIGSEKKMEYTVVGDKVDLAQRIEGQTDRGQILVDATTYAHIKD